MMNESEFPMSNEKSAVCLDALSLDEIMTHVGKHPIDLKKAHELFEREPNLKQVFNVWSRKYTTEIVEMVGPSVQLHPHIVHRLQELFVWSMAVGYLLHSDFLGTYFEKNLLKQIKKEK